MAVTTTNNAGYLSALTSEWTNEFDLTSIDIQQYPPGFNGAVITLRRGKNRVGFQMDARAFDMDQLRRGLPVVKEAVYINTKKLPQNRLDMRYNSIEGMNDFLTLISRSRENSNEIDTVVLTPEQVMILQREAMQNTRPDLMGQPILTIYGYTVETKGQD